MYDWYNDLWKELKVTEDQIKRLESKRATQLSFWERKALNASIQDLVQIRKKLNSKLEALKQGRLKWRF